MEFPTDKYVRVSDLEWDLKGPCSDCPFRRDAPDHEGVAKAVVGYYETMENHKFAHTCHKTDNRPVCDGPRNHDGPVQHCGGALLFVAKADVPFQRPMMLAAEAGKLDLDALFERAKKDKLVFGSFQELAAYYLKMAQRILADKPKETPCPAT